MPSVGALYRSVLGRTIRKTFPLWEKLGFHVTPCHYYEPIPEIGKLPASLWERESPMLGVSMNDAAQIDFLQNVCMRFKSEYDQFGLHAPEGDCPYYVYNGRFGEIDGDLLYCMVRHFKPRKIIEVGSGWSTRIAAYALQKNAKEFGADSELVAIEPYPKPWLTDGSIGNLTLVEKFVQGVEMPLFESLGENDILFLDSTHVVNIGSDVCHEFFEILPRLNKGVIVHIHDIFLPCEYPKRWVKDLRIFWNEQYLLQAFLMHNTAFEVLFAANWMKTKHPDLCARAFRSQAAQSFWIRKVV